MINYSIVIPHKNNPELLSRCLKSIPAREDIEIIIVDDCSEDTKRPQIDREDATVITLTKVESKGAGHARNVGIKKSIGKWLLFADCDDYYYPAFIEELDRFVDSNYDIIFYDYGTNIKRDSISLFKRTLYTMQRGGKVERANFKHLLNAPWNKMYKAEFIKANNIEFEEIPIQNDAYFVHKASSLTDNFYYTDKELYFYEINNNGITLSKKRSIDDIKISIDTMLKVDKLKALSNAWGTIVLWVPKYKSFINDYGLLFVLNIYIKRIKIGLLYFQLRKMLWKIKTLLH